MDIKKELESSPELLAHYEQLNSLNESLELMYQKHYHRSLPFSDHIGDRWKRAERLGFGKGTNIYDSSYVIGDVQVGVNCWIGMFTILDGSGNLKIGDNCTISAGVHVYTHDNVKSTLSGGKIPIKREPVLIGNNCYIGPHSILSKGITLGNFCVVAANSFVNSSFPDNSIIGGVPAKAIGIVKIQEDEIIFEYNKHG